MDASTTARGYLPPVERVGNVVISTFDPAIAWRLGEAMRLDPFARMRVLGYIESALREYLDDVVPAGRGDLLGE